MDQEKTDLLSEFGKAAFEYLELEQKAKEAKCEYIAVRNKYLQLIDPACIVRVRDLIEDDDFQLMTGSQYQAYKAAKRQAYNAKRRLDTKFRNLKFGGV